MNRKKFTEAWIKKSKQQQTDISVSDIQDAEYTSQLVFAGPASLSLDIPSDISTAGDTQLVLQNC